MYNCHPDNNHSLMKITLKYYKETFSSHLFNIYELKDDICLISKDEDQFSCSVKCFDMYTVYEYDTSLLEIIANECTSTAKKYIFFFEYIISNSCVFPLYLSPTDSTLHKTYGLNAKFITLISSKAKLMQVKVANYLSYPFSIDTYGLSGLIKWKQTKPPKTISVPFVFPRDNKPDVAVVIRTSELYPNSTIVTFKSRFIFINRLGHPINIKAIGPTGSSLLIADNSIKELYTSFNSNLFQVTMDGFFSDIFNIEKVDECDVKLQIKTDGNKELLDKYGFSYDDTSYFMIIRVSVTTIDGASVFITLSHPKFPLLEIENETDEKLELAVSQSEVIYIEQKKKVPFCWRNNEEQNTDLNCRIFNTEVKFSFSKFDKKVIDVTTHTSEKRKLYISVSTENDGYTRLFKIKFTDKQAEKLSSYQKFYVKKKAPKATKINFSLYGIGVSIMDSKPQELFYISLYGIDLHVTNTIIKNNNIVKNIEKYLLFLKNIQIDYCLNDSFRNIFNPKTQILPSTEKEMLNSSQNVYYPFVQAYFCREKTHNLISEEKVEKYQQVDFILQEFCVNIEQNALQRGFDVFNTYSSLIDFHKNEFKDKEQYEKDILISDDIEIPPLKVLVGSSEDNRSGRMILINYLFLSGLKFQLTIKLDLDELNYKYIPPLINKIVISLGDSLGSITKSPIKFSEMIYQNVFINTNKLISLLISHYKTQGLTQIYKLLGNSDLLGNPIKLVDNIGTGFIELFNEPRKGFLQGPNKFGKGLSKGVKSLLENVVGGGCDSVVSVTGTLIKASKKLKGGKQKKKDEPFESSPEGVVDGVVSGVEKSGEELRGGLEGIFVNPYRNAKINGVKGFITGLSTGIIGALISPFTALFTFTNSIAAGMRNTAIKFAGGKIHTSRFRHSRVIYQGEPLTPYDPHLAEVNEILYRMKITNYNKILLFADIKKESDDNKFLTVILTDIFFLVTYNLIESPLMIKVRDVKNCSVHLSGKMYVVVFEKTNGDREAFRLYEQKVACRIYDMFRMINLGFIQVNKDTKKDSDEEEEEDDFLDISR